METLATILQYVTGPAGAVVIAYLVIRDYQARNRELVQAVIDMSKASQGTAQQLADSVKSLQH